MLTNLNISELTPAEYFENKTWMIIHSKSRREKKIAQNCTNTDIKYYLPLEKRIKIYGRKKVQTTLPLFPGYLFCFASEKERYQLLLTHQDANILLLYTSTNGIKLGCCFFSQPYQNENVQNASFILLMVAKVGLPKKFQFSLIQDLEEDYQMLEDIVIVSIFNSKRAPPFPGE